MLYKEEAGGFFFFSSPLPRLIDVFHLCIFALGFVWLAGFYYDIPLLSSCNSFWF
jgi:hypothetical protein